MKRQHPVEGDAIIILNEDRTETYAKVVSTLDTMFTVCLDNTHEVKFLYYDRYKGTEWTYPDPFRSF
jgi:hypothetical protein